MQLEQLGVEVAIQSTSWAAGVQYCFLPQRQVQVRSFSP